MTPEQPKVCKYCGGKGYFIEDYNDPGNYYGHGQREIPCEHCQLGKRDDEGEIDPDR